MNNEIKGKKNKTKRKKKGKKKNKKKKKKYGVAGVNLGGTSYFTQNMLFFGLIILVIAIVGYFLFIVKRQEGRERKNR